MSLPVKEFMTGTLFIGKHLILGACLLLVLASCSLNSDSRLDCLIGEGNLMSETRALGGNFKAIQHQMPGTIYITQGSTPSLTIEGQPNLLPVLTSGVTNEVLSLTFSECIESGMPFNVFVTVIELQAISISGLGDVVMENELITDRLELFISGLGNYDLRGTADSVEITISGQGNVNGFDLITEHCDILIAGSGEVEITANRSLFVTINGEGNVYYKGMPTVFSDINGSGTVNDAN